MIKKVKSFVIDRALWGNGDVIKEAEKFFFDDDDTENYNPSNGADNSFLLRRDGLMCCLGIYAKACGAEDKDILRITMPEKVVNDEVVQLFDSWGNSELVQVAHDNDHVGEDSKERESKIAEFFKSGGVTVTFKGAISDAIHKMRNYDW